MAMAMALVVLAPLATARVPQVTAEDYRRAERMLAHRMTPLVEGAVRNVTWIDEGSVAYVVHDARGDHAMRFDLGSDAPVAAFDQSALARAINKARPDATPVKADKLPAFAVKPAAGGGYEIVVDARRYRCSAQQDCVALERPEHGKEPGVTSPDGRKEAFIRDWNLWLRDLATGTETPLTRDGVTDYGYATDNAGWTHSDRAILVWSPDSKKIATFRQDQRRTSTMTLVETTIGAPRVKQWKYPFVGDEHVTMIERVVIDLSGDTPRTIRLQMPPDQHRSTFCDDVSCKGGWEDVQWAPDGRTLAFVSTDRGHKWAQLRVADAVTGEVRDVFRETVKTHYESGQGEANWRYLPESDEFVWFSEESDWGHLYLHDLATGKRKRQLTRGDWNVTQVAHLDRASRTVLFRGVGREAGRDPYLVHYYKVGLDGGDVQLLTPEAANHVVEPSPDGRHFVDTYSTVDTAPVTVLRDGDGRLVSELARVDLSRAKAAGWVPPERFTVKARDGRTDLYGQMFKPSRFDPSRKYPIVVYIYPGPQVGSIRSRSFVPAHLDHQALAELGFVVVAIDGTCTPLRSKSFHDACYGDMADNTLPDQVAALQQLAARHAWIDLPRAGIWGHSGGGNATAAAMFRYPDLFKVGIAESGNHDNLSYEDDWAERYHGLLKKHKDGTSNYTGQDNAAHAGNLKGKLFLIHGMMDDNVPPQSTLLVVDALVKANKDFDLLLLPHARHGFGKDGYYVMRRRWDYFVEHLLGARPPKEHRIEPPAP
jgi:dipeptidyl aminopeptidase/acylaminoacyl peptidase